MDFSHSNVIGIIGPSGAGKSTIVSSVVKAFDLEIIPTYTDRPRRANEREFEHRFIDKKTFDNMASAHEFVLVAQPFGLPYRYGLVLPKSLKTPCLLMLRAPFVPEFRRIFTNGIIIQIETDISTAQRVIHLRTKKTEDLGSRLSNYQQEVTLGRKMADSTIFHDFQNTDAAINECISCINHYLLSRVTKPGVHSRAYVTDTLTSPTDGILSGLTVRRQQK